MDAAESVVVEPVVDKFAGMSFGQACLMLFEECKSSAPSAEVFESSLAFIEKIHQVMGVEFSREEYWNYGTIEGSHPVFPVGLGADLNVIPEVLTKDFLINLREKAGGIQTVNEEFRERITNMQRAASNPRGSGVGHIDSRTLTRQVNSAATYVDESLPADEDDFL